MGPEADTDLIIPYLNGMIPETATPGGRRGDLVDIIDQDINPALFVFNLLEETGDLVINTVIDLHTITLATGSINSLDTGLQGKFTCSGCTPGDVNRGSLFGKRYSAALANASSGTSHNTDFPF
jgi:hypothetical protein